MSGHCRAPDPNTFHDHLRSAWSRESSSRWNAENPARGQCGVTALVVQDFFGGEILKTQTPGGVHFYNRIKGRRWDFTVSQFESPVAFDDTPSDRSEAFADTSAAQYEALSKHLLESLNNPRA